MHSLLEIGLGRKRLDWEENREGERDLGAWLQAQGEEERGGSGQAGWGGGAWWLDGGLLLLGRGGEERGGRKMCPGEVGWLRVVAGSRGDREVGWQQGRKRLDWEENREGGRERGWGMAASTGRRRETEFTCRGRWLPSTTKLPSMKEKPELGSRVLHGNQLGKEV